MSFYTSVLLQFTTPEISKSYVNLLARETRPIFLEDVDNGMQDAYSVIEEIDYPSSINQDETKLSVRWYEMDDLEIQFLIPLFELPDVKLVIGYEIDTYADSSDNSEEDMDGFFLCLDNEKYRRYRREAILEKMPIELVTSVSKLEA